MTKIKSTSLVLFMLAVIWSVAPTIHITRAQQHSPGQVYVAGQVIRPQAITFKESMTLTQVIKMAGGISPDGRKDKVRIIRQTGAQMRCAFIVNLREMKKHRAEDVVLQVNDVVEVLSKNPATPMRIPGYNPPPLCSKVQTVTPLQLRVIP